MLSTYPLWKQTIRTANSHNVHPYTPTFVFAFKHWYCPVQLAATLDDHVTSAKMTTMFNVQLHCVSCKTGLGLNSEAGIYFLCTDNSRPPCCCYLRSIQWDKWVLDYVPWTNTCVYLCLPYMLHMGVDLILVHGSVVWIGVTRGPSHGLCLGHLVEHKNSSQPLPVSANGSRSFCKFSQCSK